jgi:hypothetical protein
MLRREFVVRVVGGGVVSGTAAGLAGCGTLFHKERIGQPHSHQIDWCVAAADGLGLLLFFIPGVIAFVVDFYTGAIYLPCDTSASTGGGTGATPGSGSTLAAPAAAANGVQLTRFDQPAEQLDPRSIEHAVSRQVGRPVSLVDSDARVSELATLDEFETQRRRHDEERGFGRALRSLLTWRDA